MKLDVRLPIGGMFTLLGILLVIAGLVSEETVYERSLGINVNLWWGVVLVVFGAVMLAFALRARSAEQALQQRGEQDRRPDA
jgi:hypothetical protein